MPQRKVLIVEDDFILYDELCEFFEEKGFAIVKNRDESAVDTYEEAVALVTKHKPDIAILDIRLKGEKDGIDVGVFIKQHYHIPVIYLSAYPNPEHLERIRQSGDERFVMKASKPLDKNQLWAMFYLALPEADVRMKEKSIGKFFSVKEMRVKQENNHQRVISKEAAEPLEIQTFFKWEDIVFIESYNSKIAGSGNNNLLIHTCAPEKVYMMRSSLNELEELLPEYFSRFDQSTILNLRKITARIKQGARYLIGDLSFKMSDTYRSRAQEKIARLLSSSDLENFPEN